MKEDRRVRQTRQRLQEALLSLSIEHGYDAVTVQDVLHKADMARSTFYAHFCDKEDLLLSGLKEMRGSLPGNLFKVIPGDSHPHFGLTLFRHIDENRALARTFLGAGTSRIMQHHLRNLIEIEAKEWMKEHIGVTPANKIPMEVLVQHVAGSLIGLLIWWIDHDFPISADEMGIACEQLVNVSLYGVL